MSQDFEKHPDSLKLKQRIFVRRLQRTTDSSENFLHFALNQLATLVHLRRRTLRINPV